MSVHWKSSRSAQSPKPGDTPYLKAKRELSQNFLHDEAVLTRMADVVALALASAKAPKLVIEIGPGTGALTQHLLKQVSVYAVEKDPRAVTLLKERFAEFQKPEGGPGGTRLILAEQDIRRLDIAAVSSATGCAEPLVVGNLPYALSTDILLWCCQVAAHLKSCHFLLQREVVDRLVAKPGCKDYGRIGIFTGLHFAIQKHFDVPPEAFRPQPKVTSTFFSLLPKETAAYTPEFLKSLQDLTATLFSLRRKMLRNSLMQPCRAAQLEDPDDNGGLQRLLESFGVTLQDRVEQLTPEALVALAQFFSETGRPHQEPPEPVS